MSRIGNAPISVPSGVTIEVKDSLVTVKGAKGELNQVIHGDLDLKVEGEVATLSRTNDTKVVKAQHGLYRSLINNMIIGVDKGFSKQMELVGVGYRATTSGQILELSVGYSHPIMFSLPAEIKAKAESKKGANPIITLESCDNQLLGEVCAKIRAFRKPEPYKGKGIRFVGEVIRRKAGKTAAK